MVKLMYSLLFLLISSGILYTKEKRNDIEDTTILESESSSVIEITTESESMKSDNVDVKIMSAFQDVLLGKMEFIHTDDNDRSTNINHLDYWKRSTTNNVIKCERFAVVDMDSDGVKEVVVEIASLSDGEVLVLRHYDYKIYGYQFGFRGLNRIKIDGTFSFSSGASTGGFALLDFEGKKINSVILGESIGHVNKFYIADKGVSEDEFYNEFCKEQNGKKDVEWHNFTEDNIYKYVK